MTADRFRIERSITLLLAKSMRAVQMSSRTGDPVLQPSEWLLWNFSDNRSMDLAPDFDEFCGLLNAHEVEFVMTGVRRDDVFFEGYEARVDYNATPCNVETQIAAVAAVKDPNMPTVFRAIKK